MCWLDCFKKKSAVWTDKRDKILGWNNILLEKVFGRKKSWMENFVSEKVFGLKNVGRFLVVTPFFCIFLLVGSYQPRLGLKLDYDKNC